MFLLLLKYGIFSGELVRSSVISLLQVPTVQPIQLFSSYPRGSIYTPIMELGSQNHSRDGLLGPNSIIVVYMDPLGTRKPSTARVRDWALK